MRRFEITSHDGEVLYRTNNRVDADNRFEALRRAAVRERLILTDRETGAVLQDWTMPPSALEDDPFFNFVTDLPRGSVNFYLQSSGDALQDRHVHRYTFNRSCGANVCECGDHKGLARCFCGWSRSGGDGYRELIEMGETIDPDE